MRGEEVNIRLEKANTGLTQESGELYYVWRCKYVSSKNTFVIFAEDKGKEKI